MTRYYYGAIHFQGTLSREEQTDVVNILAIDNGEHYFSADGKITLFEFSECITNIDETDLGNMEEHFRTSHPIVFGHIHYYGDYEGQYIYDPDENSWGHEELEFLSDVSLASLRARLDKVSVKEKSIGIPESGYDYLLNETTDDDLVDGKDVISQIHIEMFDDDENDSQKLIDLYRAANTRERAIMDAVMVCVCGRAMSHIIQEAPDLKADNLTNGDVIKAMFPNAEITMPKANIPSEFLSVNVFHSIGNHNYYKLDWWNAPYERNKNANCNECARINDARIES